jgi:hypothetical protein
MSSNTIRLAEIAHARSGDKGNHANVAIIAYTPAGFEFIKEFLTAERIAEYFRALEPRTVERYLAANVWACNFVLYDALGGGASRSMRSDNQGKALGQAALLMEIPEPPNLDAMRRSEGKKP